MSEPTAPHPGDGRTYLPAMGRDALLPLYDPFTRLLGAGTAHRRLLDKADIQPGQRVLEIGCGTGNLLLLAKRRHPRADLVGLDPDPTALARAGRKARRARLDVRLDRGFADELPYPDASIDHVLSAFMLHHLPPPEQQRTLGEIRRVLTPGGSLHLLDFTGSTPHTRGLLGRLPHRGDRDHAHQGDGPHARRHGRPTGHASTSTQIRALMTEAGLTTALETAHRLAIFGRYTCYHAHPGH